MQNSQEHLRFFKSTFDFQVIFWNLLGMKVHPNKTLVSLLLKMAFLTNFFYYAALDLTVHT